MDVQLDVMEEKDDLQRRVIYTNKNIPELYLNVIEILEKFLE